METKKDTLLSAEPKEQQEEEFLASLDDYVPTIPDEVIQYYLNRTGFISNDTKVKRLVALATQKFISDITNDALQYCKIRQTSGSKKQQPDKRLVLTMEDLSQSSKDYGIHIKKPEYFSNKPGNASLEQ